jgi:hypothetical protein
MKEAVPPEFPHPPRRRTIPTSATGQYMPLKISNRVIKVTKVKAIIGPTFDVLSWNQNAFKTSN